MAEREHRSLTLACVADGSAAATLYETLGVLFPEATIERFGGEVTPTLSDVVDCAIIDASVAGARGLDMLRRFRAVGYDGAAVLLIDESDPGAAADAAAAAGVGARSCALAGNPPTALGAAIADALRVHDGGTEGAASAEAVRDLRRLEQLVAAGELAMELRHSLNNPLAALLAELQLLEFEPLAADHKEAVRRIISLARRVIGVVRTLDGIGKA
jgi:signal transduction histidine kinase